jgi:hypothetical protein
MNRSDWIRISKKLAGAALIVVSAVIAYVIFAAVKEFFETWSTSISTYTLVALLVALVCAIKLIQILRD